MSKPTLKFRVRLSLEEETSLFSRLKNGDETARGEIINAHLGIPEYYSHHYAGLLNAPGLRSELQQQRQEALLNATYHFNVSHKSHARFGTYAQKEVAGAVANHAYFLQDTVRHPRHLQTCLKCVEELRFTLGRQPTIEETLNKCKGCPKTYTNFVLGDLPKNKVSISDSAGDDGNSQEAFAGGPLLGYSQTDTVGDHLADPEQDTFNDVARQEQLLGLLLAFLSFPITTASSSLGTLD